MPEKKFCFFTNPVLLGTQAPEEAFGPTPADNNSFLCTDRHSASPGAPVVAICNGQLRAQRDSGGAGLNLILKPDGQMPFDFPFISYFIYKGVDPASLLDGDAIVAKGSATDIELVDALHEIWEANANLGSPDKSVLGIDLGSGTSAADYADDRPIDRLFYGAPKERPPIPVKAGQRIGRFAAQFGLEILVEEIGRQPLLGRARSPTTVLTAPALDWTKPPDDAVSFKDWHDTREAVLGFVDPCAFWGAFIDDGLDKSKANDKVAGNQIYADILRGAAGESAAAFVGRNRAYIDIRNEHGQSMNYYRSPSIGNQVLLGFEGDTVLAGRDYYQSGWPCLWIDGTGLPVPASAGQLGVQIALPATDYSRPLPYISVGYVIPARGDRARRPVIDTERFVDVGTDGDTPFLKPMRIAVPLVPSGPRAPIASYQKICHFKRPLEDAETTPPPLAAAPHNLAPVPIKPLDHAVPMPGAPLLPGSGTKVAIKTYADVVLIAMPSDAGAAFVARPGFAQDPSNVYLFLFPVLRQPGGKRNKTLPRDPGPPSLVFVDKFFREFARKWIHGKYSRRSIDTVPTGNTPTGTIVEVVHGTRRSSDFLAVVLKRIDYEPAALSPNLSTRVVEGTGLLSLALSDSPLIDVNGNQYVEAVATYSRLTMPLAPADGDLVVRQTQLPFPTLYADENPRR